MYAVIVNQSGYLPDNEPNEFNTLAEAKENARSIIREYVDGNGLDDSEYKYQAWENMRKVTKTMLEHSGEITLGVLYRPDSKYDLGYAVSLTLTD